VIFKTTSTIGAKPMGGEGRMKRKRGISPLLNALAIPNE
jgi:hypothetical protein